MSLPKSLIPRAKPAKRDKRRRPLYSDNVLTLKDQIAGYSLPETVKKGTPSTPVKDLKPPAGVLFGRARARKVTLERSGPAALPVAETDEFGNFRQGQVLTLGTRGRENIAIARRDGMVYTGQAGTIEEQIIYGELVQRGFDYGLGASATCFGWQVPEHGQVLDFVVWRDGEVIALRPQNRYWHGHLEKISADEERADTLRLLGYTVFDIWSEDTFHDETREMKFNQFGLDLGA